MKRISCFLIVAFTLIYAPPVSANTPDLIFFVFSAKTLPVHGILYTHPYTQNPQSIQDIIGAYDNVKMKYIFHFTNLSPQYTYDAFFYQTSGNMFSPEDDSSVFADNTGQGFPNTGFSGSVLILSSPIQHALLLTKQEIDATTFSLTIQSTDGAIDFSSYPKDALIFSLTSTGAQYAVKPALDTHCPSYDCESIHATFPMLPPGDYDLIVSYAKQSIASIRHAITVNALPPILSPEIHSQVPPKQVVPSAVLGIQTTTTMLPSLPTPIPTISKQPQKSYSSPTFISILLNSIHTLFLTIIHAITSSI